jgi:SAM-dependent methyltransferase
MNCESGALSTQETWDSYFSRAGMGVRVLPNPDRDRFDREFSEILRKCLGGTDHLTRVLEMGCGGSVWLPYLAKNFGCEVSGIDYLDRGCELARRNLNAVGVSGRILQADFNDLDSSMGLSLSNFDLVFSIGVVEHFADPAALIGRFAGCLNQGGKIITIIPNLTGIQGWWWRAFCPNVYKVHNVIRLGALVEAHVGNGLELLESGYMLCPLSLWWLFPEGLRRPWGYLAGKLAGASERLFFALKARVGLCLQLAPLSSALVVVARKRD